MNDPKRQPWLYLISGLVAVGAATFFLSVDGNVFDWAILGLGLYAIWKGIQLFREQAAAGPGNPGSSDSTADPGDVTTGADEADGPDGQSEPRDS